MKKVWVGGQEMNFWHWAVDKTIYFWQFEEYFRQPVS
jgi:hypothetical protein